MRRRGPEVPIGILVFLVVRVPFSYAPDKIFYTDGGIWGVYLDTETRDRIARSVGEGISVRPNGGSQCGLDAIFGGIIVALVIR